jgi:BirA family biotin operon repressor/biotin-[acetyl-CoA-carboxylase] ligase
VFSDDYQDWGVSVPHGVEARFYEQCGSTNEVAGDLARVGTQGPVWIVAGQQSAGRGRRGREWLSRSGNLYASLLFRPSLKPADLAALPYIAALAVRDTFISLGADPADVACKWPNDVLIDGRKASGILIESSARSANALDFVIVGIGMNLIHAPDADAAIFPAASLKQVTGREVTVRDALEALSQHIYVRLDNWIVANISSVVAEWSDCAWGLGERREIRTHNEQFVATPTGLADDGGLIVKLDDGREKRLYAGDVFPVSRTS